METLEHYYNRYKALVFKYFLIFYILFYFYMFSIWEDIEHSVTTDVRESVFIIFECLFKDLKADLNMQLTSFLFL